MSANTAKRIIVALAVSIWTVVFAVHAYAAVDHRLVKTADDPKIFLVIENRRIHIPNPSVFEAGGYRWSDVETILQKQMDAIRNTALIKSPSDAKVYLITNGKKAWIPSEQAFLGAGLRWDDIVVISQAQVDYYSAVDFEKQDAKVATRNIESAEKTDTSSNRPSASALQTENITQVAPEQNGTAGARREYPNVTIVDFGDTWVMDMNNNGTLLTSNQILSTNGNTFLPNNFEARKINNNGVVAGHVMRNDVNKAAIFKNGVVTELSMRGGHSIIDMNDSGDVLINVSVMSITQSSDSSEEHYYVWNDSGVKEMTGFNGGFMSAVAINQAGIIAGTAQTENGEMHAVVWENGMIKDMNPQGCARSESFDINDSSDVFGTVCAEKSGEKYQYAVWKNGKIARQFSGGYELVGEMKYMNNAGDIAGSMYFESLYTKGLLDAVIMKDNKIINLNNLLPNDTGIILRSVIEINDSGQALARGKDSLDDDESTYLLTLPENITDFAVTRLGKKIEQPKKTTEVTKVTKGL